MLDSIKNFIKSFFTTQKDDIEVIQTEISTKETFIEHGHMYDGGTVGIDGNLDSFVGMYDSELTLVAVETPITESAE